ncbi:hypothetical protein RBB78_20645 [Tunturiibacter empetritectus]|uniref:hypothetical protein n=1 Tax=Tunturiibacter empetritectus TaxID=3069691 RepID=UPI003D9B2587
MTPANDSNIGLTVLQMLDTLARDPKKNLASAAYIAGAKTNNFSQNSPFSKDAISYDIKSDWTISQKDHLSGRFSHQKITTFQAPLFGSFLGGPAGGGSKLPERRPLTAPASTTITSFRQPCLPRHALV